MATSTKTGPQRLKPRNYASANGTAEQAAEKCNGARKKLSSGAEAGESTQFTSALKHRPPEEKDAFRSRQSRAVMYCTDRGAGLKAQRLHLLLPAEAGLNVAAAE